MLMPGDAVQGPGEGEGYRVCADERHAALGEGEVVIGRSSYCSLVLEHETLSRVHASLRVVGDGVELSDLGSSNGTYVNGVPIKGPTIVRPGDDIRLGRVRIWIEIASARVSAATGRFNVLREFPTSLQEETTTVAHVKLGLPGDGGSS
jgi:FHA domain